RAPAALAGAGALGVFVLALVFRDGTYGDLEGLGLGPDAVRRVALKIDAWWHGAPREALLGAAFELARVVLHVGLAAIAGRRLAAGKPAFAFAAALQLPFALFERLALAWGGAAVFVAYGALVLGGVAMARASSGSPAR
ncbi:MAG: hypothetical protein AAGH15_21515, partial [Myxococcota bacterium]